jgi:hypothetical protein
MEVTIKGQIPKYVYKYAYANNWKVLQLHVCRAGPRRWSKNSSSKMNELNGKLKFKSGEVN